MDCQICVNCDVQAGYPHHKHCPGAKFTGEPNRFSPNWADDVLSLLRRVYEKANIEPTQHRSVIFALLKMFPPAELIKVLNKSIGAPGDYGYSTPLGSLLQKIYGGQV